MGQKYSEWGQVKVNKLTKGSGSSTAGSFVSLLALLCSLVLECVVSCGLGALSLLDSKASHFLYLACTIRIHRILVYAYQCLLPTEFLTHFLGSKFKFTAKMKVKLDNCL